MKIPEGFTCALICLLISLVAEGLVYCYHPCHPEAGEYVVQRHVFSHGTLPSTLRMLALLDIQNKIQDLLEIISRFPGVLPVRLPSNWACPPF